MGHDVRREFERVDEEDSHDVPREVLEAIVARIREEERQRWQQACRPTMVAEEAMSCMDLDNTLDGSSPRRIGPRFWSPGPFFATLGLLAAVPLAIIYWMFVR